jgi:hypothetical protein
MPISLYPRGGVNKNLGGDSQVLKLALSAPRLFAEGLLYVQDTQVLKCVDLRPSTP